MTRVPRPIAVKHVTEQSSALKQLSLYRDTAPNMDWHGYCAVISAFFATSVLRRPCHGYADGGASDDTFHTDLAATRGIVFG